MDALPNDGLLMHGERVLVLGVGNPLMRDDGIGPRVIELLMSDYEFADCVDVLDAGTMSFSILNLISQADRLIVVDAVRDTGYPAGTVMRLTPEQIAPNQIRHSMHDVALVDVLQAVELMGSAPAAVAIGVQIEAIEEAVMELSPPVESAVSVAAAAVLDELLRLGVPAMPSKNDPHTGRVSPVYPHREDALADGA
jgi:hydrogenase maturation protease